MMWLTLLGSYRVSDSPSKEPRGQTPPLYCRGSKAQWGPASAQPPGVGEPGRKAASSMKPSCARRRGRPDRREGGRQCREDSDDSYNRDRGWPQPPFLHPAPLATEDKGVRGGQGARLKQGSCISLSFCSSRPCPDGSFLEPAPVRKQRTFIWRALHFL